MEASEKIASVSVVIPCYRCTDTIERAVKSVAEQTLKPYEVILVEDCSCDNTLEVLYALQAKYGKVWIKVVPLIENSGPGTARNIGWDFSKQSYIAFLDSDDSWHPQKIEIQYSWMKAHGDVAITGHNTEQIELKGESMFFFPNQDFQFNKISKNQILLSNPFSTRSIMIKRDISNRFVDGKRYCEDYWLWSDIFSDGLLCFKVNLSLAYSYKSDYGQSGLSSALWKMELGELSVYRHLYSKEFINPLFLAMLFSYSFIKYLKRTLFSYIRN